jgi:hypothetical protein
VKHLSKNNLAFVEKKKSYMRRGVLIQLSKNSEDHEIKSEPICLGTYEIENFEFLKNKYLA